MKLRKNKVTIEGKETKVDIFVREYGALRKVQKILGANNIPLVILPKYLLTKSVYSGTVTCHDEDEYSYSEGIRLAYEKAERNYQNAINRRVKRYFREISNFFSMIDKSMNPEDCKCNCGNNCKCK